MADLYVAPWGSDANDGSGPGADKAFLTPAKAAAVVSAGTTIYLAPGTYRLGATVVSPLGAAGDTILWHGDPHAQHFPEAQPGPVRFTGCDANEVPALVDTLLLLRQYTTVEDIVFDGQKTGTTAAAVRVWSAGEPEVAMRRCIVAAATLAVDWSAHATAQVTDCVIVSGENAGSRLPSFRRCIIVCPRTVGAAVENCVLFLVYGTVTGAASHCVALGGAPAFFNNTTHNCVAFGCDIGYLGNLGKGPHYNAVAVNCRVGFAGTLTANDCGVVSCSIASQGTVNTDAGYAALAEFPHVGYTDYARLMSLATLLQFDLNFSADKGASFDDVPDHDILGRGRPARVGNAYTPGPWEHPLPGPFALDQSTGHGDDPHSVVVLRAGEQIDTLWLQGGVEATISAWCKFTLDGGDPPQLEVRGDGVTTATTTATGDGSDWEQLQVTVTPSYDTLVQVVYRARDAAATAAARWSDLAVEVAE